MKRMSIGFIAALAFLISSISFGATPLPAERFIAGGVTGTVLGLGIGHGVQGRWNEKGWIFLLGGLF